MLNIIKYLIIGVAFTAFGSYAFFIVVPSFSEEQKVYKKLCEEGKTTLAIVKDEYKKIDFETTSLKKGSRTSITYEVYFDYKVNNKDYVLTLETRDFPKSKKVELTYLPKNPKIARPGNVCQEASLKDSGLSGGLKAISVLMMLVGGFSLFKLLKLFIQKKRS